MNLSAINYKSTLGKLLRAPLRLIPSEAQIPILQGKLRGKRWIVGSGTHGCWLGSYEYDKQRLFEQTIASGSTVYDIGANVGFYTLLASVLVGETGHIFAFEPLPRNVLYLREHIRLNALTNVQTLAVAVADYTGFASFAEDVNASQGHIAVQGTLTVETVCLDELIQQGKLPTPDYIKIDVEGAELAVFAGARQMLTKAHPVIFLATHGQSIHHQCCEMLTSFGYQLQAIDPHTSIDTTSEILAFVQ